MKAFLVSICVMAVVGMAMAEPHTCDEKKLDQCARDVIPYSGRSRMGETKEEIAADCAKANTGLKCLHEIADSGCVKSGLAKGVYKLIIEGTEEVSNGRCDEKHPKHGEYVKNIPCLNKVGKEVEKCISTMTAETEAANSQPVNERVPRLCCSFQAMDKCVRAVAEKSCSAEHADYVSFIVNGVAEAAVETICTKYKGDVCKKYEPLKLSATTKSVTLVPPVVNILSL